PIISEVPSWILTDVLMARLSESKNAVGNSSDATGRITLESIMSVIESPTLICGVTRRVTPVWLRSAVVVCRPLPAISVDDWVPTVVAAVTAIVAGLLLRVRILGLARYLASPAVSTARKPAVSCWKDNRPKVMPELNAPPPDPDAPPGVDPAAIWSG